MQFKVRSFWCHSSDASQWSTDLLHVCSQCWQTSTQAWSKMNCGIWQSAVNKWISKGQKTSSNSNVLFEIEIFELRLTSLHCNAWLNVWVGLSGTVTQVSLVSNNLDIFWLLLSVAISCLRIQQLQWRCVACRVVKWASVVHRSEKLMITKCHIYTAYVVIVLPFLHVCYLTGHLYAVSILGSNTACITATVWTPVIPTPTKLSLKQVHTTVRTHAHTEVQLIVETPGY